jgi:hypothetical protein
MSADDQIIAEQIEIQAHWVGLDEMPIVAANQLIGQVNQGEVFLTFGQVAPPVIVDSAPERVKEQLEGLIIPIRPVVRMQMTPERLREMVGALNEVLDKHEMQVRAAAKTEAGQ